MDVNKFNLQGFAITPPLIGEEECISIESSLSSIGEKGIGTRNMLDHAWCRKLAQSMKEEPLLRSLLSNDMAAVQCTYFEKSTDQNWLVPLHQDLSIPVKEKIAHPSLSGWSEKEGGIFVQPPVDLLEKLLAIRLHLDECGTEDGPLRVVPGSHRSGKLDMQSTQKERDQNGEFVCVVKKGAALLMRPLLLHASSKSNGNNKRRVLHFLFGPKELPFGLRWQHTV